MVYKEKNNEVIFNRKLQISIAKFNVIQTFFLLFVWESKITLAIQC